MSAAALTALIARCRSVCRPRSQADDAELLRRFAQQRDAVAFEELLERHAVLVWGVCRRVLSNEADCEDAFQATFLALVRRADAVGARPSLGAWLHTVAVRVARKARAHSRRRHPFVGSYRGNEAEAVYRTHKTGPKNRLFTRWQEAGFGSSLGWHPPVGCSRGA